MSLHQTWTPGPTFNMQSTRKMSLRRRQSRQQELQKQRRKQRSTFSPTDLRPQLLPPVPRPPSSLDPWRIYSLTGTGERKAQLNQPASRRKAAQRAEGSVQPEISSGQSAH